MLKAVLKNGTILPLEPLPSDWRDGQQLNVESADNAPEPQTPPDAVDRDFAELAALCAGGDAAEDERLSQAIAEAQRQARQQVRRQMGLP